MLATALAACGQAENEADEPSRGDGPGLRDPGTDDFAYEDGTFERGSRRERMRLLRKFRAVQKDFYAGDARAVCAGFDTERLGFEPERCVRDVRKAAAAVASGEARWPLRRVLWARIYEDTAGVEAVGGVTVSPDLRVGFVERDNRWKADFGVPGELSGLSTRLRPR